MSRERVGLGVSSTSVRVVVVRAGVLVRQASFEWGLAKPLHLAVREALESCSSTRWPRRSVYAAVGPTLAHFRPLHGIPAQMSSSLATRVLRENAERFFIGEAGVLDVTAVSASGDRPWAGALQREIVAEIARGCASAKHRLRGCAPTLALLGAMLPNDAVDWRDGDHVVTAVYSDGRAVQIQRARGAHDSELPHLGGQENFDAIAAAVSASSSPFVFDPERALRAQRRRVFARIAVSAAFALSLVFALLGPGLLAVRRTAVAEREFSAISAAVAAAAARLDGHAGRLKEISAITEFERAAPPAVAMLASISRVLPESTAIVSFRMEPRGLTFVALAPAGAQVVERLSEVRWIERPQIVGAITRETIAGRALQRVAVSARIRPAFDRGGSGDAH